MTTKSSRLRASFRTIVIAALGLLAAMPVAMAQSFPTKPVHLVVPFPPGGSTDLIARGLAEGLRKIWNQPVVVDNKPGSSQFVGSIYVENAAPDGYTILIANDAGLESNLFLYSELPYNPRKYTLITRLVQVHEMLVVSPSLPVNSLKEFVEYAKKNDKLFYSSPTVGSPEHIGMESLKVAAGFKMNHVAYKGMAPAIQGILTGDVQALVTSALAAGPHIKSGKLKPLAIAGDKRSASIPDMPTFKEAGYPEISLGFWQALVAPAGTPADIANKIAADVRAVMDSAEFRQRFVEPFEYTVIGDTPAEFSRYYQTSLPKAEKRVKDSGAKLEKE